MPSYYHLAVKAPPLPSSHPAACFVPLALLLSRNMALLPGIILLIAEHQPLPNSLVIRFYNAESPTSIYAPYTIEASSLSIVMNEIKK